MALYSNNLSFYRLFFLLAISLPAWCCHTDTATTAPASAERGEALARQYCANCHAFPEPDLLDRITWERHVLPKMANRLGLYHRSIPEVLLDRGPEGQRVRQHAVFPTETVIDSNDFRDIEAYYSARAPGQLPATPPQEIRKRLPGFAVERPTFRESPPMSTTLHIDEAHGRLLLGDTKRDASALSVLTGRGEHRHTFVFPGAPVDIVLADEAAYLLTIGFFLPSDLPRGQLYRLSLDRGEISDIEPLLSDLQRPVNLTVADLDGDGLNDFVVSEFGNQIGALKIYYATADGGYRGKAISATPGALRSVIRDADQDGDLDIFALFGQGDERLSLFVQEEGRFREQRLLRFPSSHGSTWFELVDWDKDGLEDILYVCGDNGDYDPIIKPYHGIRLYRNQGGGNYTEAFFLSLPGATRAVVRDFDRDGDYDLAAVAFYPDFTDGGQNGFVYYENTSTASPAFRAYTIPETTTGRWITLDAGDLDGDGDQDLALASFTAFAPHRDPQKLFRQWTTEGPSVLLLRNLIQ